MTDPQIEALADEAVATFGLATPIDFERIAQE
jgi:hypothetical protein